MFERTTTSFPNSCSLSHLISIFSDYINSTNNADYKLNYGSDEHHFINDINYKSIGISVYNDIIKKTLKTTLKITLIISILESYLYLQITKRIY